MTRLLFSTGSLYPIDTAYCFELAHDAGFAGIEVMCDARWSTRDPHYLKRLSERHNLPVKVLHTPFSASLTGWDDANYDEVARVRCTVQLAESLSAEAVVLHLPRAFSWASLNMRGRQVRFPWLDRTRRLKSWFAHGLADLQGETRVKIAVENMPLWDMWGRKVNYSYWNSVEAWSGVHDWLTLDTTHWATHGIDPLAAYDAARERVCHIHLSNYDGREHRLPHQGAVRLDKFLQGLAEDDFSGTISLEVHPDALEFSDDARVRQNLRESVEFCRMHLA